MGPSHKADASLRLHAPSLSLVPQRKRGRKKGKTKCSLDAVSPDGKWAVVRAPKAPHNNSVVVKLISTGRESPFLVCDTCMWGPGAIRAPILYWSANGKDLFVSLQYFGLHSQRTAVLPYRSDWPPEKFWPKGLKSEKELAALPGITMINEPDVFPGPNISRYLFWKGTGQSNLYRIRIPQ